MCNALHTDRTGRLSTKLLSLFVELFSILYTGHTHSFQFPHAENDPTTGCDTLHTTHTRDSPASRVTSQTLENEIVCTA